MIRQNPDSPQTASPASGSLLDRLFLLLERYACEHPVTVVIAFLIVAALSIWGTVESLTFKTGRGDLVSKDLPYVKTYEKYRDTFEDFEGMIVVIEGDTPAEMKSFAEALAEKLGGHSSVFSKILYKIDTAYFKDKGLFYMSLEELADLRAKLEERQTFLEDVNASPGLNQLLDSINSEISAGMVDAMLTGFLGGEEETQKKDETNDLKLLIALLKQMETQVQGNASYQSPWKTFLSGHGGSLREDGYLVSDNDKLMFFFIVPHEDETVFAGYKDAIDFTRGVLAEVLSQFPGVRAGLTGEDVISSDEMITTQADVQKASIIALVGVALLFILAYQGVVKPLLAIFCLVVALCWSMGYTTLVVGHLNILSVVFTTILIGLGIDFGIHILERYKEEKLAGRDTMTSLQNTVRGTGKGNFAGAITIAIAFGGMAFTDFVGIVELGVIASGGIMLCMFAMIVLLPATVILEERWFAPVYKKSLWVGKMNGGIERFFDHYWWIITVSLVLFVLSLFSFGSIHFDYNLINLQAKDTEGVRYEIKIIDNAKRSIWSMAMIADTLDEAKSKYAALKAMPEVADVESIISLLPEHQDEKQAFMKTMIPQVDRMQVHPEDEAFSLDRLEMTLKKIRFKLQGREDKAAEDDPVREAGALAQKTLDALKSIPAEDANKRLEEFSRNLFLDYREKFSDLKTNVHASSVNIDELPPLVRNRFVSKDNRYLLSIYPSINIWDADEREKLMVKLAAIDSEVTGNAVHMFKSSQLMKDGYIQGGIYAMVAIILYVLLTVRNFRTTLFVLLPVVFGSVWTIGIMSLAGISFNLANLVILPLILGIGVVNGVHVVHRYREEEDKTTTVLARSTGQAVVLSSLTTMIGFGSLMVADHQGIFSLGLLLTLGVGSCLVASITVLPALLKLATSRGWEL